MAHIDSYAPGGFCWFELGTTDQNAAKSFYGALFGWSSNDIPMAPGEVYVMFQLAGRDSAACYQLNKDMLARGIPPHWMLYVAVASADATTAKVAGLGGTVNMGPFDVFDVGRMAVIQDPTGAVISIWESRRHKGSGITGVHGTFCWADLSTSDTAKAEEFYSGLFGWAFDPGKEPANGYLHIRNGENFIGGMPPSKYRDPNVPPHWLLYFLVDDVDATAGQAQSLGAKLMMPPSTIADVGRMAVVQDPQGSVFAVFKAAAVGH